MADYYTVLTRAIAALPENTETTRRRVYERASAVLMGQLQALDPPLSADDLARHRASLEAVIARIEAEAGRTPEQPAMPPLPDPTPGLDDELPPAPVSVATSSPVGAAPTGAETAPRPRLKPLAPRTAHDGLRRKAIVAGGVLVAVGVVAGIAAYVNREPGPAINVPTAADPVGAPVSEAPPKVSERLVNGLPATAPVPVAPAPVPGPQADTAPAAAPPEPAQSPAATAPAPVAPAPPPPSTAPVSPAPSSPAGVAVAQRAVIYLEGRDSAQPTRTLEGRAFWRLESVPAGQGRPAETVLRADIDNPALGLSLVFTVRKNTDPSLPASHLIGLRFNRSGEAATMTIAEAGPPQLKAEEGVRGAPLSAVVRPLGPDLFLVALSRVDIEVTRNLDLLRSLNWIDVPVRFATGQRALIAFEKGVSGERALAEALRLWR